MFASGKDPGDIVKEKGLVQISDKSAIMAVVEDVLAKIPNPRQTSGPEERALGFLVGQVMKTTRGKANPNWLISF